MESKAEIKLETTRAEARVRWERSGKGQHGLLERRELRGLPPVERRKRLAELCGASAELEITHAGLQELDDESAPFGLECEGLLVHPSAGSEVERYTVSFAGPWVP